MCDTGVLLAVGRHALPESFPCGRLTARGDPLDLEQWIVEDITGGQRCNLVQQLYHRTCDHAFLFGTHTQNKHEMADMYVLHA